MSRQPIQVRVCDKREVVFKGTGYYYPNGKVRLVIDEFDHVLIIDPESYNNDNPKRLMYKDDDGEYRWSRYYLRSMLLDIKKRSPKKT